MGMGGRITSRQASLMKTPGSFIPTLFALMATTALSTVIQSAAASSLPNPRTEGWLVKSYEQIAVPSAPKNNQSDVAALKVIVAKRSAENIARFHWWSAGGPAYRWNEIILNETQEGFVTVPFATRHLALFHAALDDAIAAARHHSKSKAPGEPAKVDAAIKASDTSMAVSSASEHAAAAAAAAGVLGYLFPARAAHFSAKAEEAMQSRLLAGAELPHEVAAGRAIGQGVAALAIARGKADGSDMKWSGSVPQGDGYWKGTNPLAPQAANWQTWVLASPNEFRPAPPPAFDSDQTKAALSELKSFARTPKSNHRATYWEVHGGARVHNLWNEIARTKLLETGASPATASRVLAALNIALADAGTACWDAKYTYWYIRPPQLDSELKPLFTPPGHPSYPAAHGCFSSAAATVLAGVFSLDRDPLLALGKEASEARVWAGIHYRFDIDAGQELGRKVGERALERAFAAPRTN
jgi:membrane-associated phospholipid phosphatase